jgi:hypothetical protein
VIQSFVFISFLNCVLYYVIIRISSMCIFKTFTVNNATDFLIVMIYNIIITDIILTITSTIAVIVTVLFIKNSYHPYNK